MSGIGTGPANQGSVLGRILHVGELGEGNAMNSRVKMVHDDLTRVFG
jgi:hypothetical protein